MKEERQRIWSCCCILFTALGGPVLVIVGLPLIVDATHPAVGVVVPCLLLLICVFFACHIRNKQQLEDDLQPSSLPEDPAPQSIGASAGLVAADVRAVVIRSTGKYIARGEDDQIVVKTGGATADLTAFWTLPAYALAMSANAIAVAIERRGGHITSTIQMVGESKWLRVQEEEALPSSNDCREVVKVVLTSVQHAASPWKLVSKGPKLGADGRFYCGRFVGCENYHHGKNRWQGHGSEYECRCNGTCGPSDGCQCADCYRQTFESEGWLGTFALVYESRGNSLALTLAEEGGLALQDISASDCPPQQWTLTVVSEADLEAAVLAATTAEFCSEVPDEGASVPLALPMSVRMDFMTGASEKELQV